MAKHNSKEVLGAGALLDIVAIPYNFLSGFLTGLIAPIAAIAGMVALIRLLTGKVPYLSHIFTGDEGERHLSFELVAPEQVKEMFEEQKEEYGGDILKMQAEIKAIIEETRAEAKAAAEEKGTEEA
jgi:F0F1-type ATP synthase membrane subunit b/b'